MAIEKLKTKFVTGAFVNDVKHFFKKINELVDKVNTLEVNTTPNYKIYRALLNQTGTDAPVATVLENSLNITLDFQYDISGQYFAPFTTDLSKTTVNIANSSANLGLPYLYSASTTVINYLNVNTWDLSGNGVDNVLVNTLIEIIVYN